MRKLPLVLLLCVLGIASRAQTTVISTTAEGGFESGTTFAANGWTSVNGSSNMWVVGTAATAFAGSRGAYISTSGSGYDYSLTTSRTSHFYRDVTIPSGGTAITLSFQWKGKGESSFDRLLIYTAPTSVVPAAGVPASSSTTLTGATLQWTQPTYTVTAYQSASVTLPSALAGTTFRLIFTWQNDGSGGVSPPIAIDNIGLVYTAAPACSSTPSPGTVVASAVTGCSSYSSTLTLSGTSAVSGLNYQWQSSTDSSSWSNISAATNASLTTTISSTKYYRCTVTCAATSQSANTPGKKLSLNTSTPSYASLPFFEGFESNWLSYCNISERPSISWVNTPVTGNNSWRRSDDTSAVNSGGWSGPTSGMFTPWGSGSTYAARFHSYYASSGLTGTLDLYVNMSISGSKKISYDYINIDGTDKIMVQVSTDGGTTFTTLDSTGTATSWTTRSITTSVTGNAIIRFKGTSDFGFSDMGLDNVSVCGVANIGGASVACIGTPLSLTETTTGGTWQSSNTSVATVDTGGHVNGIASGIVNISYTVSAGCYSIKQVSVNVMPSAITGSTSICHGSTSSLSNAVSGGSWTSSNTSVASVDASTGIVTGTGPGSATVTYSNGCSVNTTISVTATPSNPVMTPASVNNCGGNLITLSASSTYPATVYSQNFNSGLGSWTITNTAGVAESYWQIRNSPGYSTIPGDGTPMLLAAPDAVNALTNTVATSPSFSLAGYTNATLKLNQYYLYYSGDATAAIQYSVDGGTTWNNMANLTGSTTGSTSWSAASPNSTYAFPAAAIGQSNVKIRFNYVSTWGYYWAVDNIVITGGAAPVASWSPTTGLYTDSTLTTPYTGSSLSKVYTMPSVTGTPVSNTYTVSMTNSGCFRSNSVNVTVNPPAGAISGPSLLLAGSMNTYFTGSAGTWTSSNTAVATVDSTGHVTGISAGSVNITYINPYGCFSTRALSVAAPLPAIMGSPLICMGNTSMLTDSIPGGTWSSSDSGVAVISSTGVITGMNPGTSVITYSTGSSYATLQITVNPTPDVYSYTTVYSICVNNSMPFYSSYGGGVWSTSNPSVAILDSMGFALGLNAGVTNIAYTIMSTGCSSAISLTVNPNPAPIIGPATIALGVPTTMSDPTVGGTWFTSSFSAMIDPSTGVINAIETGGNVVTYQTPTGCIATKFIAINNPGSTYGTSEDPCTSWNYISMGTLSSFVAIGGTSMAVSPDGIPYVAYVNMSNSITVKKYTGSDWILVGDANIHPSIGVMGYNNKIPMSFDASGNLYVLAEVTGSGLEVVKFDGSSWSIAGGVVISAFDMTDGIPHYPASMSVSGDGTILVGAEYPAGLSRIWKYNGSWSAVGGGFPGATVPQVASDIMGTPYVAYIGDSSASHVSVRKFDSTGWSNVGSTGFAHVPYGMGTPALSLAIHNTTPYLAFVNEENSQKAAVMSYAGGSWNNVGGTGFSESSANSVSMIIDNAGAPNVVFTEYIHSLKASVVKYNGSSWVAMGGSNFTIGSGTTANLCVDYTNKLYMGYHENDLGSVPAAMELAPSLQVSGPSMLAVSASAPMTTTVPGGAWTSTNTSVAIVSASGVVTGITPGSAAINYTLPTGCTASRMVSIMADSSAIPPIVGSTTLCAGTTSTLSDSYPGGTWSIGDTSVANIGFSTGIVTAMAAGSAVVTYTTPAGSAYALVTVLSPSAGTVFGLDSLCVGMQSFFVASAPGGFWSSSNTAVASADASSGLVVALTAGSTIISYTTETACGVAVATKTLFTRSALLPNGGSISGPSVVCPGTTITLSHISTSLSLSGSATIAGPIQYTTANNGSGLSGLWGGIPYAISGAPVMLAPAGDTTGCAPFPASYFAGKVALIYRGGCEFGYKALQAQDAGATACIIINNIAGAPSAMGIGGFGGAVSIPVFMVSQATGAAMAAQLHDSMTVSLNVMLDSSSSGSWSGGDSLHAMVSGDGIVTGISEGETTITYTVVNDCGSAIAIKTISVAAPSAGIIEGSTTLCEGTITHYFSTVSGGSWSSSNPTVANVDADGYVTTFAAGSTTLSYTLSTACGLSTATLDITVTSGLMPVPGYITAPASVCVGSSTPLSTSGVHFTVTAPGSISGEKNITTANNGSGATDSWGGVATAFSSLEVKKGPATDTNGCTAFPAGYFTGKVALIWRGSCEFGFKALQAQDAGAVACIIVNNIPGLPSNMAIGAYGSSVTIPVYMVSMADGNAMGAQLNAAETVTASVNIGGTPGGSWTSSNDSIAVIDSSGALIALSTGSVTISYFVANSCAGSYTTKTISVTSGADAGAIEGLSTVCVGSAITMSESVSGGSWSCSNPAVATISASGIVAGVSSGSVLISYVVSSTCGTAIATKFVIVNAGPSAGTITGATSVNTGATSFYSTTGTPGGMWTTSNTNASIDSSGMLTGLAVGSVTISYTVSNSCGSATAIKTVNITVPLPVLEGSNTVCVGSTTTITSSTGGGSWYSSAPSVAYIYTTGVVSGLVAGTAIISYVVPGSPVATMTMTVYPQPANITGTTNICAGSSATLSNTTSGGVWTSANTAIANVGLSTGIVTGVASGAVAISYTLPTGCAKTLNMTINAAPTSIGGSANLCIGSTTTLSNGVAGGTWSSTATSIVSVGAASGIVTGLAAGTANITYALAGGCKVNLVVTVGATPAVISGTLKACPGTTTTLTDATTGGTWSSSNDSVATAGATTGIITGVAAGTVYITYTSAAGCFRTAMVTINPLPAPIAGTLNLCQGATTALSDPTSGGTSWTSSTTSVATVNSSSGVVTGVAGGTSTITYTVSTGCRITAVVTVTALPAAISGTLKACVGATTSLSDATTGGTWTSSNVAVGTIGSATGVVTGIAAGTTTVTYTVGIGCIKTAVVTINALPAAIGGTLSVCQGSITTLSSTGGGTWTSGNTAVATIVSTNGAATGISAGTASITYTLSTGCYTTATLTVNPLPSAITGGGTLCNGSSTTLTDVDAGGTWTSSNTGVASIGSATGVLSGVANGTARITYTFSATGCRTTTVVTVSSGPAAITGTLGVCSGNNTTLADATTGGTWSSGNTAVATISSTGVVAGMSAGTSIITYATGATCRATAIVTVSTIGTISGTGSVCAGSTTSLSIGSTGGTWSSGTTAVATISTAGVVTGVAAGTTNISYTLAGGCRATTTVTVNALPNTITGTMTVCEGSTTTLADATTGGAWSTSSSSASVDAVTGVVTGLSAGTASVSYTLTTGCSRSATVTVNLLPTSISGSGSVGAGSTISLSDATSGGTWSSSFTSVISVNATTGVVTGLSAGTALVTYTLATGCKVTAMVTINAMPAAITGTLKACPGTTTTLADATAGGTWSSSNPATASVDAMTGIVTGVTAGTVTISYITTPTTYATAIVTINPLPAPIGGTLTVCVGSTTALTDATGGGMSWTSSNTAVATVNSASGVVSGIAAGTATITYTLSTGCVAVAEVTVNALPSAITGMLTVCAGATTTLANTDAGSWSSSNTSVAMADASTGIITGIASGTASISFTSAMGCIRTAIVSVNASPAPIGGSLTVCAGLTTALTNTNPGGTWSSGDMSVANITTGGVVTGVASGTATIAYTTGTGCSATVTVTVNSAPATISGSASLCIGSAGTLTNTGLGTWSSSNTAVASVGAMTGIATGIAAGTSRITFTADANGCTSTVVVTVNALPASISGTLGLCAGNTGTLTNTTTGGSWSSTDPSVASIDATTGIVTALMAGTSQISYTAATGCAATAIVTVSNLSGITGTAAVCPGSTTSLSVATGGGTWSSNLTPVATVNSSGVVTGVAAGTATISYVIPGGCFATTTVTVNSLPANITGTPNVCETFTTTLGNTTSGGTWSSSNMAIGTIDASTGAITGILAGTSTVSYTLSTGCAKSVTFTVNAQPAAISGAAATGVGSTITLSDATSGGAWSSSFTSTVSVNASTGVVTALAAGTALVTYTMPTGCKELATVTVNPAPAPITGTMKACPGTTTTLADATGGGTWSSSNTAVATADVSTGIVTGVATGTVTISYITGPGSYAVATVTINPNPAAIAGTLGICAGSTTGLSDPTSGGLSWTSSTTSVATVNSSSGIVSGLSAGTSTITYTISTGCYATAVVTVTSLSGLTGTLTVCSGTTTSLGNSASGGNWSSQNTSVATVGSSSGVVSGVAAGTSRITYSLNGCIATAVVTVTASPAAIGGTPVACVGTTTTLNCTGGSTWSSSNTAVATVAGGVVSGVSAGTARITYSAISGCYSTVVVTINGAPVANTGVTPVCKGASITLGNPQAGGTWSSSSTSFATVGSSSGLVTGVGAGTVRITYTLSPGCFSVSVVTINASPSAITGTMTVCAGAATTLSNSSGTGVWSSTNTAVGTVGSISAVAGRVMGISAGTTTISFAFTSNGCAATTVVTVNAAPVAGTISGSNGFALHTSLAPTSTTLSTSGTTGGTWTSSASGIASVNASSGLVTAVAPGNATITYSVTLGSCSATATQTINVVSPRPGGNNSVTVVVEDVHLYPNPNNGIFSVKGTLEGMDGEATIEVTNVAGQVVFNGKAAITDGAIDQRIVLDNTLANGMYLLSIRTQSGTKMIHFVIAQ